MITHIPTHYIQLYLTTSTEVQILILTIITHRYKNILSIKYNFHFYTGLNHTIIGGSPKMTICDILNVKFIK